MTKEELAAEAAKQGLSVVSTGAAVAAKAVMADNTQFNNSHRSVAVGVGGSGTEAVRVNMAAGNANQNNIIQFNINNSQAGAQNEVVRIGSSLGLADAYIRYGTTKSAADSTAGISDDFGNDVQMCQGFSEMSTHTPVFIKEIKLISSDTTQLNAVFSHKTILPDFTIIPLVQNIAFTREKSDYATNLNVANGSWLLSSKNFLEFSSIAGQQIQIIVQLASISDVREFIQF